MAQCVEYDNVGIMAEWLNNSMAQCMLDVMAMILYDSFILSTCYFLLNTYDF